MKRHNSTFYAGLGIGAGLFGIRLVSAGTTGNVIFALALTITEFSVVWLWERKTSDLGDRISDWEEGEAERSRKRGLSKASDENLADRQRLVDEIESEIAAMDREYEREHLLADKKTLVAIATNAIRAGYFAGISANAAAVSGAANLEIHDDEEEKS